MKIRTILFVGLSLLISSPVSAVMLSSDEQGQVLIFPYFGTLGGNSTVLSISSQNTGPKALKVHFRDRQGEVAQTFNLYLEGRGSWVAALSQVDGETVLTLPDASCVVPKLDDGFGSTTVALTSGYLEVIEMGTISDSGIQTLIENFDCDALNALWVENSQWANEPSFGLTPPRGDLRGTGSLINIERGTMYSFVATALTQFSDIQQHSAPDEPLPNLTSGHDAGTDNGATTSVVCDEGKCIEDTWERPVDAVAAAIMAHEFYGEFSTEESIGALTEVVLTYPLQSFYSDENNFPLGNPQTLIEIHDRNGEEDPGGGFGCIPLIDSFCAGTWSKRSNAGIDLLSFYDSAADEGSEKVSKILGESYTAFFPDETVSTIPDTGSVWIGFEVPIPEALRSLSGRTYLGVPVIGFVIQQFTNGYLQDSNGDSIRANYGNAFELSRKK